MKNRKTYHIFFNNLSNPLRINIVTSLYEKDKSVNELVKEIKQEQSKISHALASLRKCNVVEVKQKGKLRIYSLSLAGNFSFITFSTSFGEIHFNASTLAPNFSFPSVASHKK